MAASMAAPMPVPMDGVQSYAPPSATAQEIEALEETYRPASTVEADSMDDDDEWDWENNVSSITSSVFDYEYENGRRYHGYKAGVYPLPNDEKELDRLDLQYHVFTLALGGELYLSPLKNPKRVLDIGTGTGLWAIQMADQHPEANVLGVDLSPSQPDMVPENAHFEIDDVEAKWLHKENYFDFIHSRVMIGAISDWKKLLRQSLTHLKPGGWLELQELDPRVCSDDGTHLNSPNNVRYNVEIIRASEKYGKRVPRYTELMGMLQEAGFVDVQARFYKIPYNPWPKDARLKEIGKYQLLNYFEGYEAIGIGLFTRALGWTDNEFQVFLASIRNELRDRSIHTYSTFAVVYGRKPPSSSNGGTPEPRSRRTSPTSMDGSVDTARSTPPHKAAKARPPVPLFPKDEAKLALPQMAAQPAATVVADGQFADTRVRPNFPGSALFKLGENGEVVRVNEGDGVARSAGAAQQEGAAAPPPPPPTPVTAQSGSAMGGPNNQSGLGVAKTDFVAKEQANRGIVAQ